MKIYQKDNEIIVSQLRQMSEIPNAEYVLISIKGEIYPGRHLNGFIRFADQNYYGARANDCDGWLPMPQYRPELKQTKENDIDYYHGA